MSSPPQTPTHRPISSHRRHPSSLDMTLNTSSRRQSMNRRSSGYSPMTPRSSQDFDHGSPAQHFDGGMGRNGLGNLADELGEIWDDEEGPIDGEFGEELDVTQETDFSGIGTAVEHDGSSGMDSAVNTNAVRDSGVAMHTSSPPRLSPGSAIKTRKHTRQRSLYDGSDYGEDSDLDNEGISHTLDVRMSAIESLVRRGTEDNGSASDQVVKRVVDQLRDLGSQMAIENGSTRHAQPRNDNGRNANRYQTQDRSRCPDDPSHPSVAHTYIARCILLWATPHHSRPRKHRGPPPTHRFHSRTPSTRFHRPARRALPSHKLNP